MRGLLIYTLIGCGLVGLLSGWHAGKCPHDKDISATEIAAAVAAWPAIIVGAVAYGATKTERHPLCDAQ